MPSDIGFKTKPEIALEQMRWACEAGLPRGVVLMDVAYGNDSRLRTGMTALGLSYVAGIQPNILMWPSGTGPKRRGKPLNNTGRRDEPDLISAKEVALGSAQACLAHDQMAGRLGRLAVFALRARARRRRA